MPRPTQIKYHGRIYVKATDVESPGDKTLTGTADEVREAVAALDPALANLKAAAKSLADPPTPAQLNAMDRNLSRVLEVLGVLPHAWTRLRVRLAAGDGVYGKLQKLRGRIVERS